MNIKKIECLLLSRYCAHIVEVDESDLTVLIHFDGWNSRYDEWVEMSSDRLRPITRHSERKVKKGTNIRSVSVYEIDRGKWDMYKLYMYSETCFMITLQLHKKWSYITGSLLLEVQMYRNVGPCSY